MKRFKELREDRINSMHDNPISMTLMITRSIKKEVFDLSDTMDLLAQVI